MRDERLWDLAADVAAEVDGYARRDDAYGLRAWAMAQLDVDDDGVLVTYGGPTVVYDIDEGVAWAHEQGEPEARVHLPGTSAAFAREALDDLR